MLYVPLNRKQGVAATEGAGRSTYKRSPIDSAVAGARGMQHVLKLQVAIYRLKMWVGSWPESFFVVWVVVAPNISDSTEWTLCDQHAAVLCILPDAHCICLGVNRPSFALQGSMVGRSDVQYAEALSRLSATMHVCISAGFRGLHICWLASKAHGFTTTFLQHKSGVQLWSRAQ